MAKRTNPTPPNDYSSFVDAAVLINRPADEYVAVFGIAQEGVDIKEARAKADAAAEKLVKAVANLGVKENDIYVDYISQNRVYGYQIEGDTAREQIVGFEVKKNVSIHYKSAQLINQLSEVASTAGIYDLIKVDYVVTDAKAMQKQLFIEASKIIKEKLANRANLLGTVAPTNLQVYVEDYSSYYPTTAYSGYVAQQSESLGGYRPNMVTIGARKTQTVYFDPLGQDLFDTVINPVVIEPVVQFTVYLRVLASNPPPAVEKKQ